MPGWAATIPNDQLMPNSNTTPCLILACGNTLRSDDGVAPRLAEWAEERFRTEPGVQVLSRQQWTPELAEDIARAQSVVFIDCSAASAPGSIDLIQVEPAAASPRFSTHHLGASELLALAREFYGSCPLEPVLLTVGGGSTQLGEEFSDAVSVALP